MRNPTRTPLKLAIRYLMAWFYSGDFSLIGLMEQWFVVAGLVVPFWWNVGKDLCCLLQDRI